LKAKGLFNDHPYNIDIFGTLSTPTAYAADQVDLCLQPVTSSTNNAVARGKTPLSALEKPEVVRAVRSGQLNQIRAEVARYQSGVLENSRPALEYLAMQVFVNSP
jgi:ATP-dependent helicase HepA